MAGYAPDYAMSNNAVAAYRRGCKPLSRITASDLREAGWAHTLAFAVWLADEGRWRYSEYHHTSKYYREAEFYDPLDLVEWWNELDPQKRQALKAEYKLARETEKAEAKANAASYRVAGTYTKWSGSRRHPKRSAISFTGELRGEWIFLDGGGKKRADGNWISWERADNRAGG